MQDEYDHDCWTYGHAPHRFWEHRRRQIPEVDQEVAESIEAVEAAKTPTTKVKAVALRFVALIELMKIWGVLRCDDGLGMMTGTMRCSDRSIKVKI